MSFEKKKTTIAESCAPKAGTAQSLQQNSRIWSLTQMGAGMAGPDLRILSCVFESRSDEHGNFQGETPYPLIGEIQHYPAISRVQKSVEYRPAVTVDGPTGLLYRKLPSANGFANSWLTSAETSMHSLIETWGRVTSDHNASVYRFERLNLPARVNNGIPDVDELIDELLADYVIDSLDHPVLQRLLNQSSSQGNRGYEFTTNAVADEEDDIEIY